MSPNAVDDALVYLWDHGYKARLKLKTYYNIAEVGFNSSTLAQSFVLAQILLENHPISVRGAFYRAVSAGIYPNTDKKHYRQACNIILKLRRSGNVPYSWVTDGTRLVYKPSSWSGLADFSETVRDSYRKDFWASQTAYVEVIVEKDAMSGVLRPVADKYDIALNVIRGNSSETFVWNLAERLLEIQKPIHVYYLGDHDPNGLDIERDIRDRLYGFMQRDVSWMRLGITTEEFFSRDDLTGFPVRMVEKSHGWKTRCGAYKKKFGDKCVEIDALPPNEIRQRLTETIEAHINQEAWRKLQAVEALERETIVKTFQAWKSAA